VGGNGKQPGGERGTGGQGEFGGGPAKGGAPGGPESAKDGPKPTTTRANEPESQGGDTVAPSGQPQSDLFLRKLDEALQNDAKARDLEKDTGLSREKLEQFAQKFKKLKSEAAGPGREIKAKPGEQPAATPSANLPGLSSSVPFSTINRRRAGSAPHDEVRENLEGPRMEPPPEFRGRWEGYKNRLRNVVAPKAAPRPSTKKDQ
jgi:hypothetical protein